MTELALRHEKCGWTNSILALHMHLYICLITVLIVCIDLFLGMYVNKPSAKFPYSKIMQCGIKIEGLPSGVSLKHPSSYGKDVLKDILSRKGQLKIQGTYTLEQTTVLCHKQISVMW